MAQKEAVVRTQDLVEGKHGFRLDVQIDAAVLLAKKIPKQVRPGRKIGHVTVLAQNKAELAERLERLSKVVPVPDAAVVSAGR